MQLAQMALVGQGHGSDMLFGPQQILSDQLITCIANLAHHHKITSVQTLTDQTSWNTVLKYGKEILSIVRMHFPPPSSSSRPVLTDSSVLNSEAYTTAPCHGKKCGSPFHIGEFEFQWWSYIIYLTLSPASNMEFPQYTHRDENTVPVLPTSKCAYCCSVCKAPGHGGKLTNTVFMYCVLNLTILL
jgi:hypothetical protein